MNPISDWTSEEEPLCPKTSRRGLLALGGAAALGLGLPAFARGGTVVENRKRDIDILNFALNLEYLDAEYYTYATTGHGIDGEGVAVDGEGNSGPTTGGARVTFSSPENEAMARQIAADERAQILLIRQTIQTLGGKPIAKPAINLLAAREMGIDPTTEDGFLLATRAFEDVAISAYGFNGAFLTVPAVIRDSARIMSVEAYHSGAVRHEIVRRRLTVRPVDIKDMPPTQDMPFPVMRGGVPPVRTPAEVLQVVTMGTRPGGFLPAGPNGNVRALLSLR